MMTTMTLRPPWFRSVRRVFVDLVRHELHEILPTLRFRIAALLVVALTLISAVLCSARYRGESEAFREASSHYTESLAGSTVTSLAAMSHPAFKPPWRLAFLSDGAPSSGFDVYSQTLSPWDEPELGHQRSVGPRSEPLDNLFIIRVLLSLSAFLLGYDAVCGRRQRRRLRLVLTYAYSRPQVLTVKLVTLWTCLAAPFLAGVILALPILVFHGGITFQAGEVVKVGMVIFLGLWAAGLFALMALLVSTLSRAAEHSLAVSALLWVTAVVVIPAAAGLIAQMVRPLPSEQEIARRMQEVQQQMLTAEDGVTRTWRRPELAAADGYALERRSAAVENERYRRQEALRRDLVERQLAQVTLVRDLASLSPMALLQDLAERLLGSGVYRDRRFVEQAWAFRDVLASHVQALDRDDPASPHILFFPGYLSTRPVAAAAVPRFAFSEASPGEGYGAKGHGAATGRLFALLAWTVALAAAAYAAFARWEVE